MGHGSLRLLLLGWWSFRMLLLLYSLIEQPLSNGIFSLWMVSVMLRIIAIDFGLIC